jgi:hypothetical protein
LPLDGTKNLQLDGKNRAPVFSASRRIRRDTACFAPPCKPAPSLKLPTGQFLNARPWLVPGRYPDSATLLQPSFAQQRLHPLLPGRYA